MIATVEDRGHTYRIDLNQPLDLSLVLRAGEDNPRAWYVDPPRMEPVMTDQFTGSTELGGMVNFRDVYLNPHGHGTHTECVGHISNPILYLNDYLERFWFGAVLTTVKPAILDADDRYRKAGDRVLLPHQLEGLNPDGKANAVIIRTAPNTDAKRSQVYSGSNPPYLHLDAMRKLVEQGFEHVLIDLPSVDRELDEGLLECHHLFWNYPEDPHYHRTITELIYAPDSIADGFYLLNLQVAPFRNDAAPSRPVLYRPL